jgi:hypothetical protein
MQHDLQHRLSTLSKLVAIQRDSNEKGYMHGMLNGLILANAIMVGENRPKFADSPGKKGNTKIRHKKGKR